MIPGGGRFRELQQLGIDGDVVTECIAAAREGIGHHQCSQNAVSPWVLSRPAQNTPSSTSARAMIRFARLTS